MLLLKRCVRFIDLCCYNMSMPRAEKTRNYHDLKTELDELMAWFDNRDVDPEEAIEKFEKGQMLLAELEKKLTEAENKITKVTQKFGT